MELDAARIAGWIEPLGKRAGEILEVFVESRREAVLELVDGRVESVEAGRISGASARWAFGGAESLAFVPHGDEAGAREGVRALQISLGRTPIPSRPAGPGGPAAPPPEGSDVERWSRRLAALLARHAPRHRLRWSLVETERQVIPARGDAAFFSRRLVSLEGTFTAASRRGDETRRFSFHAPDADATPDELRNAFLRAAEPRDAKVPCTEGETDVLLAGGCAAVLFHEILSHPLEAGEMSPLSSLEQAKVAIPELDVRDDPTRLELFGGYERDDEGVKPRAVKLLDAGHLAGRLFDQRHAPPAGSNGHGRRAAASDAPLPRSSNLVVAAGHATADEMARRLNSGLWIGELGGGSIELPSGRYRLRFPRARRVRRGRLADECGPGVLAGEILPTLKAIEPGLGRDVHAYRAFGWCSRGGQVIPVQGAAPDVLLRGVAVRSSA
ncbi:MAG TPA: metallopeptidase TldD-related protein [Thermoanaerobaculia bacterium]|nr:metallopeptidase TldD-related protein [Thermoanaerobaculia bacterium]